MLVVVLMTICVEGAVLGGILGGGAGVAASRGDGRWWAIPLASLAAVCLDVRLMGLTTVPPKVYNQ